MNDSDPLKEYKEKRDLSSTPEPEGILGETSNKIFVIQKHDARNLHYDFRIEADGTLKSWAIPKGPSMDPKIKRLAIPTEDHPMEYASFEGIIPEGNYGAGTVLVWDKGTFRNMKGDEINLSKNIEEGHATVWLEGEKLRGGFALIKTSKGENPRWLFFKMKDENAAPGSNILDERPESVLTGRTLKEIEENETSSNLEDFS